MIKCVTWNSASKSSWMVTFSTPFWACHHVRYWSSLAASKIIYAYVNFMFDCFRFINKMLQLHITFNNILNSAYLKVPNDIQYFQCDVMFVRSFAFLLVKSHTKNIFLVPLAESYIKWLGVHLFGFVEYYLLN